MIVCKYVSDHLFFFFWNFILSLSFPSSGFAVSLMYHWYRWVKRESSMCLPFVDQLQGVWNHIWPPFIISNVLNNNKISFAFIYGTSFFWLSFFFLDFSRVFIKRSSYTCHNSKWLVLSSRPAISLNGFVPELRKSSNPSPPDIINKPLCSDDFGANATDLFVLAAAVVAEADCFFFCGVLVLLSTVSMVELLLLFERLAA